MEKDCGLKILATLSREEVDEYIKKFEEDKKDMAGDSAVKKVFDQYRSSSELAEILVKVIVLNQVYSAGLNDNPSKKKSNSKRRKVKVDVYTMAEKLAEKSEAINTAIFDESESAVAVDLVLSSFCCEKYEKPYSFATKYCHWQNPQKFPIADSYSKGVLYYYFTKNSNSGLNPNEKKELTYEALNNYGTFCKYYKKFVDVMKIGDMSIKDVDEFLWKFGKKHCISVS